METIAISKFKATCLAVLKQVQNTRQPIRVTKFGTPIAEIVPPSPQARTRSWVGCLEGTIKTTGDIISPVTDDDAWDALRK